MEELEHTAKQIKANAEQLESVCLDKLAHLYQDKRRVRKQYQEEHTKIATKFSHVSTYYLYFPYAYRAFWPKTTNVWCCW